MAPRYLNETASYAVASDICQVDCQPRHRHAF
jgi:hypothetical protein